MISLEILKEKFKAAGLFPVKFVSKNPCHNGGYMKKRIKFNNTGKITPINLTALVEKLKLSFLFSLSYFKMIRNGIRKIAVGLIMILIPRITLPTNCHLISSYLIKI